jgi:hypothetical protein
MFDNRGGVSSEHRELVIDLCRVSTQQIMRRRQWPIFVETASFCRNLNNDATNAEKRCACVEYVNL